jgi:hypothetical protein
LHALAAVYVDRIQILPPVSGELAHHSHYLGYGNQDVNARNQGKAAECPRRGGGSNGSQYRQQEKGGKVSDERPNFLCVFFGAGKVASLEEYIAFLVVRIYAAPDGPGAAVRYDKEVDALAGFKMANLVAPFQGTEAQAFICRHAQFLLWRGVRGNLEDSCLVWHLEPYILILNDGIPGIFYSYLYLNEIFYGSAVVRYSDAIIFILL